jgi:dCMP deaminase
MANQAKLDQTYMDMASVLATLSHATRRKVGCLIVKDTHIIAEGINGTPKGFPNACEYTNYIDECYTKPEVLHAESNAIAKIARSNNSSVGSTLYVTLAPCFDCAKLIIQAGIDRVVFRDEYPKNGLALLNKAGVTVSQIKEITNEESTD